MLDKRTAPRESMRPSLDEMFAHLRSGEQRPAAILMTDVSGFTTIGEQAEPEWLFHLINEIFHELVDCLVAHGAHIDKYVGDEIVALFGVPVAQERSAERGIFAALAMRERVRALNEQGQFGDVVLDIHTGINVGRVMVGPVGHEAYAEYTVIGDAVNVAKRLEGEAPPGEIYVSQAVRDAVGDAFEFEGIGALNLAGRHQRVEAFRVIGARTPRAEDVHEAMADVPVAATRPGELAQLGRRSGEAKAGVQKCVHVVGPAGIGKSRLIADWSHSAAARDFRVIGGTCHACGEHFPLLPVADVTGRLMGLRLEGWPPRIAGDIDAAAVRVPLADDAKAQVVTFLRSVNQPPAEAAEDWLDDVSAGLTALLEDVTCREPLCLVVEDVQWMDEASRSVFAGVLSQQRSWPLLAVLSSRDPAPGWLADELGASPVRLEPLPPAVMERLIAAWAAPALLPASAVRAICSRAQGHPQFARELVRSLTRASSQSSELDASLPGSLEELFLAELDQLPLTLRRLVQGASVLGEPLSPHLLEAAMGEDAALTDALLWQAAERGLLRAGRVPGQFVFGRRLLFEAAYATIPPTQRRDLHARIASHLIAEMEDTGGVAVHAAAHHAYLGYRDERAIELLIRSARQYRAQYANRQAIQAATRAVELIASVPKPERLHSARLEALLLMAQSYQVVGDVGQSQGAIAEAEILAEDCPDQELVAKVATAAATLRWIEGDSAAAGRSFGRAYKAWETLGNDTRAAQALVGMGLCASQRGDRDRALELFSQAADRQNIEDWARAAALNNTGVILLEDGRYAEAEPYLIEGLRANERDGDRRGVAQSKCSVGELCYRLARFDEAKQWLSEAAADAADIEDAQCLTLAKAYLIRTHSACADTSDAGQAADVSAAAGADYPDAEAVARLAEVEALLLRGAEEEVEERLNELASADGPATGEGERSVTEWNAYAETLCVCLEASLITGRAETAGDIAKVLAQYRSNAQDRHVRRYAGWLLQAEDRSDRQLVPMPPAESCEHTVFDVRSERVVAAVSLLSPQEGA